MYNTVIFDLDGTLMNTLEDLMNSVNYSLELSGYPLRTFEEVRRFVGNGIRKLIERAVPEEASVEEIDMVHQNFSNHYKLHCNDKTGPYEDILELLEKLKNRGYILGIASNKDKAAVRTLNDIYFKGLIDGIGGAEEGKPVKPDSYMVDKVLDELGSRKVETLYVGDSQVDVQTAQNAGLDMVAVLWGFRDKEELKKAGARKFIEHPLELLQYLN